ncbi:glycerol-3-phosphate dehydrogenase [Geothrix limicola]|uniref:Glycerol-3-phosphate dehydrogenase n=1 Tax=Geothrix limicola TaxID=2927978 RepID=A0ABQ5QC43_9BACT|nr:FAD-dependent oxidoreductase [Geothrix limicola]GLH71624.1 glycerol-3-phosphate dehydrogenase [Geothrix limicola]
MGTVETAEVVIIGGGIAGLSLAFHLARAGQRGIVLLEREDQAGTYASGHNAAVARSLTGRDEHTALTVEGRRRLAEAGLMGASGGLLLSAGRGPLDALEAEAQRHGVEVSRGEGVPLSGLQAAEHLAIPGDGVIDIAGLLRACAEGARAAGADLRFGCALNRLDPAEAGFDLVTDRGPLRARTLAIAAGAWAGELGRMAGSKIAFTPLRRSLVWSAAPHPQQDPWAWWVDRPFYMRPESGGLLMCPCEEVAVPLPTRGRQPDTDATVLEGLYASLREVAPHLAERPVTRYWTGLRTFAPDRRFVLGWDPWNPRLFWSAGLGGHGMTSGLAVGAQAASRFLRLEHGGPLDPVRFMNSPFA